MVATREIELYGHIIDSYILPQVFGKIMDLGGDFKVIHFRIGTRKMERSHAKILVFGKDEEHLKSMLIELQKLGAMVVEVRDAELVPAPRHGVLPENFYSTTNHRTYVRYNGKWILARNTEMDKVLVVRGKSVVSLPMAKVKKGDLVVVGTEGIKVEMPERPREEQIFEFMGSKASSEKPSNAIIRRIAEELVTLKKRGKKIVVVVGPAVVHTGASPELASLIRKGYVNALLAGNALAVHDVEYALLGTSLGMNLTTGEVCEGGHRNHLHAINEIRKAGSLRAAVEQGVLRSGIMYECVTKNIPYVLAGSIRDDGPIPDVITDVMKAQDAMRKVLKGANLVLMMATTLHSVAVGNLLPSYVKIIIVDISPATITKLLDRGSAQALGIVTDVGLFLPSLVNEIETIESS